MTFEDVTITGPATPGTDVSALVAAVSPHAQLFGFAADQAERQVQHLARGRTTLTGWALPPDAADVIMDAAEAIGCTISVQASGDASASPRPEPIKSMTLAEQQAISVSPSAKPKQTRPPANAIRCPTCQSIQVERVTLGQRAVSGLVGGLVFSKKARASFQCRKCGYLW
ncbi:MAG: hypothetical protein ACOYLX_22345 [Burkholderiaceae bacterium]